MDSLTGAAVAAAVAWISILVAVLIPSRRPLPREPLRAVAGLTLALFALLLLGVPAPGSLPLGFLAGGLAGVWLSATLPREDQP